MIGKSRPRRTKLGRQLRAQVGEQLRLNRVWFLSLTIPVVGVALFILWWPWGNRLVDALIAGFLLGMALCVPIATLVFATYPKATGWWAEGRTSDLFAQRHPHWPVVDDVEFEFHNVDHVVMSSDGVLAIETTYLGPRTESRYGARNWQRQTTQALSSARSIRLLLRSHGIDVPVRAVVMLWGPGTPDIPRGWRLENLDAGPVDVVLGDTSEAWFERRSTGSASEGPTQAAEDIRAALLSHQLKRDKYEAQSANVPRQREKISNRISRRS